ncbi:MAG: hypothetical protein BM564_07260 [Bacteroidetes bacterium MedPE-SWsnd-G2]|nr:MAG: hypothetical protein BM564_07260 [Bacteroidetes bacterium MedPE-SWsnd-G2]
MKKITFILFCLTMMFSLEGYAQFDCSSGVVLTDGYTASNILTNGDGGIEDWNDPNPTDSCSENGFYWDDDVYLFTYTAGASPEQISMTTFTRNSWNGLAIFSSCSGTALDNCLNADVNTSGNVSHTVTANIEAGQTVYIATGQWGTPNGLDFDVTSFSVTTLDSEPDCAANALADTNPACGNYDVPFSWDASPGADGYYLTVGTTSGGNDIEDATDLGSDTSYTLLAPTLNTDYYWTVVPYNVVGSAMGCSENMFTTSTDGCYCESDTTLVDGTGISNLQVGTTDFASGGSLGYEDFTGAAVDLGAGISSNVQITFNTGYSYGVNIWIDLNDNFDFEPEELMFTGEETTGDEPVVFDASFIMPVDAPLGNHRMRIGSDDTPEDSADPCNESSWHVTMDVDVNIIEVACSPATATATLAADCDNSQFFVDVDVTDLGDATEVTDGTDTWAVSGTGVLQVGPFADGSSVDLTLTHTDAECDLALGTFSNTCPILGQICETAIEVMSVPYMTSDDTANYLDDYENGSSSCSAFYMSGDDVVYSYTPASDIVVDILLSNIGATYSGIHVLDGCPDATPNCVAFEGSSSTNDRDLQDVALTGGTTYYIVISTWATPQSTTYDLTITENTCTDATAAYSVESDCDNSGGFFVNVEITDMGTATDLTVSNDQDATTYAVTSLSTVQFGPYANGTDVVVTISDDNDVNCVQDSEALSQVACPPANNDCINAIALTNGLTFDENPLIATNLGATDSGETAPGCAFYQGGDVWYSAIIPADGYLNFEVNTDDSSITDSGGAVYTGSCGSLVLLDCNDDGSTNGAHPIITVDDVSLAGQMVYFRVWEYGNNAVGTVQVATWSPTLSLGEDNLSAFTYFPNPVTSQLTLKGQSNLNKVSIYNVVGQEVLTMEPNNVEAVMDLSSLTSGAYFVKVEINNQIETIRVIKQ